MNTNALRSSRTAFALAATLAFTACGDDDITDAGPSEPDALVVDGGGDVGSDAGTDAPDLVDAGTDAFDAGTDVGPPDPCDEEGAMRPAVCGNCGEGQELCQGGAWVLQELCIGQGECAPGAVEEMMTEMCGTNARVCGAMCSWGEFGEVVPDRDCTPEETRVNTERCAADEDAAVDVCTDECTWDESAVCENQCGVYDTDGFDEEICIPAGPFIRGIGDAPRDGPRAEVMMSAYLIDRYPVTNARYQACMTAGECTAPESPPGNTRLQNTAYANAAVRGVTWFQADAFCAWAGRRLPSEAMFEKSNRGPAPRDAPYPWDGEDYDCSVPRTGCPDQPNSWDPDDVGSQPNDQGWYGTEDAMTGGRFWASDWFDSDYYLDASSLVDPEGPAGPAVTRSTSGSLGTTSAGQAWWRGHFRPEESGAPDARIVGGLVVRCARNVEEK